MFYLDILIIDFLLIKHSCIIYTTQAIRKPSFSIFVRQLSAFLAFLLLQPLFDVAKLLLKYGANVNIPAYAGIPGCTEITPLKVAYENKNTKIVELLLKYRA